MIVSQHPPVISPNAKHADDLIAVALALRLIYQQIIDREPGYRGSHLMRAAIELEALAEYADHPPSAEIAE